MISCNGSGVFNITEKNGIRFWERTSYLPVIKSFYVIGALRNPAIPEFANELQAQGYEAFADWFSPGPDADNFWRDYSKVRGLSYKQALESYAAKHVFEFDKFHLDRCDAAVLLMPGGKSAHLELGYTIGKGKPGFIVFDEEPERYEVMTQFATEIFFSKEEFFKYLKEKQNGNRRRYNSYHQL
jgi:nucleoside 2-deoxyribosyltransferase